jgi:uncharacterized repeat protein (TIGR01451 family)
MRKLLTILLLLVVFVLSGCYSCKSHYGQDNIEPGGEGKFYWSEDCKVRPPEVPVEVSVPCATSPRTVTTARQYPIRGFEGKVVTLSKLAPTEIILNKPFEYKLIVENVTNQELLNVVVTDVKPAHMKIKKSDPDVETIGGELRWNLGTLGPQASRTITVKAVADEMGTIETCAEVTYNTPTCAKIEILNPMLKLTKHAPSDLLKCDRIPITYVITNEGTGNACNVVIEDRLPDGMTDAQGENTIRYNLDLLGPGQSREFKVMVDAEAPGKYGSIAVATASTGGIARSERPMTSITQPVLAIDESCPSSQLIGRSVTYEIVVSNKGNGVAKDTVLTASIPGNTSFKEATSGGAYTHSSPGKVTWNVGTMQPMTSKTFRMKLILENPGTMFSEASVDAFCADTVTDSCRTEIIGIPGILLEVVDTADPIEVGLTETYVITVTNQGTAEDRDIQISCFLEDTMEYVSSKGATEATLVGNEVKFAPLASLDPRKQAQWWVTVKAVSEGDVRFKTTMNSDELGRSVLETEATRFYK